MSEESMSREAKRAARAAAIESIDRLDRNRNLLYRLAEFCRTEPLECEAESFAAQLANGRASAHEPWVYVDLLLEGGAIERVGATEPNEPSHDAAALVGSGSAQAGNPAVDGDASDSEPVRLRLTQAGEEALSVLAPLNRIERTVAAHPERRSTYLETLAFCASPRTLAEVVGFFDRTPSLARETSVDSQPLAPDFYLSELERAGAIEWREGWIATADGRSFLLEAKARGWE